MQRMLAMMLATIALAACSSPPAPTAADAKPAAAGTSALAGTPIEAYGSALARAKSVQAIVDRQAAEQRKAIDQPSPSH